MTKLKKVFQLVLSISRQDVARSLAGGADYQSYGPKWWPLQLTDEQMQDIVERLRERLEASMAADDALVAATLDVVDPTKQQND